jgi:Family of unknown function (DUF5330)
MWFLIRTSFWFSLVLLALPLGGKSEGGNEPALGMTDALLAARSAAADLSGLCERSAETCEAGRKVAGEVARRAQKAAHLAALYLESDAPQKKSDAAIETGSVK